MDQTNLVHWGLIWNRFEYDLKFAMQRSPPVFPSLLLIQGSLGSHWDSVKSDLISPPGSWSCWNEPSWFPWPNLSAGTHPGPRCSLSSPQSYPGYAHYGSSGMGPVTSVWQPLPWPPMLQKFSKLCNDQGEITSAFIHYCCGNKGHLVVTADLQNL